MIPFLTVYGHISLDQIVSVDEFPRANTSVDVVTKQTSLGGTAANVAVTAARLGVPTAICAFVGNDFPKVYEDQMASSGLIMDEVVKVDGYDTSTAIVVNDHNLDQKVLFFQGPHGYASRLGMDLLKNGKQSKFIHFCTGEPEYHIHLMRELRSDGRIVAIDPAQEIHRLWDGRLLRDAMSVSDMMFCNRFEAESIKRYLGTDSFEDVNYPFILCTRGVDGCDLYLDGVALHFPIVEADKVVDATGAGDSFRAGFYAGQYHGMSIEESVIVAATVSSFIVEKVGTLTNTPTWDQVMERADKYLSRL